MSDTPDAREWPEQASGRHLDLRQDLAVPAQEVPAAFAARVGSALSAMTLPATRWLGATGHRCHRRPCRPCPRLVVSQFPSAPASGSRGHNRGPSGRFRLGGRRGSTRLRPFGAPLSTEPPDTAAHVVYRPGTRHPVNRGAPGLALLMPDAPSATDRAELRQARQRGWAISHGEVIAGLRSVAAPVRNSDGGAHGALAVVFVDDTVDTDHIGHLVATAAATVTADLRGPPLSCGGGR